MNRLYVLLLIILLPALAFSQQGFWGKIFGNEVRWDTTFYNTDSLRLAGNTITTIDSGETIYTDVLDSKDDDDIGIWWIDVDFDSSDGSGSADSLLLYVRFYLDKDIHPNRFWSVWHNIGGYMSSETLYEYDLADSTWNRPSRGKQFRATMGDTLDAVLIPGLGNYTN